MSIYYSQELYKCRSILMRSYTFLHGNSTLHCWRLLLDLHIHDTYSGHYHSRMHSQERNRTCIVHLHLVFLVVHYRCIFHWWESWTIGHRKQRKITLLSISYSQQEYRVGNDQKWEHILANKWYKLPYHLNLCNIQCKS